MRTLFKFVAISLLLSLYALSSIGILAFPAGRKRKRARLACNASFYARMGLRVLGIRVDARRRTRKSVRPRRRNHLIVANHLSYIDILVINALMPSVFITSVELMRTFPLGLFARFGGCIFVERRSPAGLKREIGEIEQVLSEGISVVLFPEGTTSNGDTVRPFKNSLITAAIRTGTDLLPVCIRYQQVNGQPMDTENRESVYYYGETTFFEHLPRLLALRSIEAECVIMRSISTHQHHSRKDLAVRVHAMISAAYHDKPSARREKTEAIRQP